MIDKELYKRDIQVSSDGLAKAINRALCGAELATYYADELARTLVYSCQSEEEFIFEYNRVSFDDIFKGVSDNAQRATLLAYFCRSVYEYAAKKGSPIEPESFFETEAVEGNMVTYVKNAVSDEAYRVFERVLGEATVFYSESFASACEEVYYGRLPFCILPYENSTEGTLSGFGALMRKYELYKQCVYSCKSENGITKLALMSRAPCVLKSYEGKRMFLRVTFYTSEQKHALLEISAAAAALSLTLIKTESVPLSFDSERYSEEITFSGEKSQIVPFLIYLALEQTDCSDKEVFFEV